MSKKNKFYRKMVSAAGRYLGLGSCLGDMAFERVMSKLGLPPPDRGKPDWRMQAAEMIAAKLPGIAKRIQVGFGAKKAARVRGRATYVKSGAAEDKFKAFYVSWEWSRLRYDFLKDRKRQCVCCGSGPETGRIVVDHIKPIRHYWHLRLNPSNLQLLCDPCNMGKGSRDETDWSTQSETPSSRLIPKDTAAVPR